jgi:prophage regulatory protein
MLSSGALHEGLAAHFNSIGSVESQPLQHNTGQSPDAGPVRFLRLSEVRTRVPYSRATIYRLIAAGQFPRPYSLGARAVAWLESDIGEWIRVRVGATPPQEREAPARSHPAAR